MGHLTTESPSVSFIVMSPNGLVRVRRPHGSFFTCDASVAGNQPRSIGKQMMSLLSAVKAQHGVSQAANKPMS